MLRAALIAGLLSLLGCLVEDRVTLRFADEATREEATRVEVFAVRTLTRGGRTLSCAELIDGARALSDDDLVIAQQVEVALPAQPDGEAVLVQVPQDAYAFYASARDDFDFLVAAGCVEDEVSSRRPLALTLDLTTQAAPGGRLELVGERDWLQSVGGADPLIATEISVRARSAAGAPLGEVEVRTLVQQGEAIVDRVLLTDAEGLAVTRPRVGIGANEILVHARGLEGSPLAFTVTGLAAARHQDVSLRLLSQPVALLAGDFFTAGDATSDLLAVLWDPIRVRGEVQIWTAALGPQDLDRLAGVDGVPAFATAGRFDNDDKLDLAVAAAEGDAIYVLRHEAQADNLSDAVVVPIFPLPLPIHALLSARVNDDDHTDLLVLTGGVPGLRLLVLIARGAPPALTYPVLFDTVQAIDLSALGEFELVAADLDTDGDDDLALLRYGTTIYLLPNGDQAGAGGGFYYGARNRVDEPWALPSLTSAEGEKRSTVADFDGDGALDLAIVVNGQLELIPPQRAAILAGDGVGRFALASPVGVGMSVVSMAVADLDADGADDIGFLGRVYAGPGEGADPDQTLDDYLLVLRSAAR